MEVLSYFRKRGGAEVIGSYVTRDSSLLSLVKAPFTAFLPYSIFFLSPSTPSHKPIMTLEIRAVSSKRRENGK
jgi:hypothetical protein